MYEAQHDDLTLYVPYSMKVNQQYRICTGVEHQDLRTGISFDGVRVRMRP